jgi:hypothetical protein
MTINPVSKKSNQNSNRVQNTLAEDYLTKTNKPNKREYGLLDDKIILPEHFAEFDLEIEKLFYGEKLKSIT